MLARAVLESMPSSRRADVAIAGAQVGTRFGSDADDPAISRDVRSPILSTTVPLCPAPHVEPRRRPGVPPGHGGPVPNPHDRAMLTLRRIDMHGPAALRGRIASAAAELRSIPERLRGSEYLQVGQSRRYRAVQRRRTRSASRAGLLVIAVANGFDALALSRLQADSVRLSISLDLAVIAFALGGWWAVDRSLRHHPEVVAWFTSFGVAASIVVTEARVPSLAVQSIGYLLVLPGLVALVLPWRTQVHVRWILAVATLAVGALALDPGGRLTGDERGDLVVVLFVALGASLAGHVLLQRAQIRNFAQLERIRALRRRADAAMFELERAHHALELE